MSTGRKKGDGLFSQLAEKIAQVESAYEGLPESQKRWLRKRGFGKAELNALVRVKSKVLNLDRVVQPKPLEAYRTGEQVDIMDFIK